ncbi:MAG: hypothetical protein NW207_00805 [Cytophagales bacterium]|nr:hypothetical protein [Cytophagales bacterium]
MYLFRNKSFAQFLSLLLCIVILNVSIDPPDAQYNADYDYELEEDLSVNEMESISEVVLEEVLDIDNAVPETDDSDTEGTLKKVEKTEIINQKLFTSALYNTTLKMIPNVRYIFNIIDITPQGILHPPCI